MRVCVRILDVASRGSEDQRRLDKMRGTKQDDNVKDLK